MLIFDYDGVLMDSVREIAVTAYNTLNGKIATRLDQIPAGARELFFRNRFHVQPIGDGLPFMRWCLETGPNDPAKLLSNKEYEAIIARSDEPVAQRTTRFFQTRGKFKAMDMAAWLALNAPFQALWWRLSEVPPERVVLLTNKNREATITLSRHFGLKIQDANVYSGDDGTTKIENMQRIMQRFEAAAYTFIDDSLKNLVELDQYFNREQTVINFILATWGYVGPDDARDARKLGYRTMTAEKFMASKELSAL